MDTDEIRHAVINVNPPKPGELTTVEAVNKDIAALCPFWTPLLKNRDLRDTEGGDQYIQGLIETFARIYTALKEKGFERCLSTLDTEALFAVDDAMAKADLNLAAEYPVLSMLDVEKLGAFGAGIYAAYGLVEMALVKPASHAKTASAKTGKINAGAQDRIEDAMASLLAEVNETAEVKTQSQAEPKPKIAASAVESRACASKPGLGAIGKTTNSALGSPIATLNIYEIKNGYRFVGDLLPTLASAAQMHEIVVKFFGVDANLVVDGNEIKIEFCMLEK